MAPITVALSRTTNGLGVRRAGEAAAAVTYAMRAQVRKDMGVVWRMAQTPCTAPRRPLIPGSMRLCGQYI